MAVKVLPANGLDQRILALVATHSPEEISDMLGRTISPAKVASHTQTLLASKSWLSAAQEDQLVTYRMNNILLKLEAQTFDLETGLGQLKILKELGNRLDKRAAATAVDLEKYHANEGAILGRVVDTALTYMKGALRGEIDAARWDELVVEAMLHARLEISKHEIEE